MSKKGPRSAAFHLLTSTLSEEVIAQYLELAYEVREKELARRREIERQKAALRRQKAAEAAARAAALAAALGLEWPGPRRPSPEKNKQRKRKKSSKAGQAKTGRATRVGRADGAGQADRTVAVAAVPSAAEAPPVQDEPGSGAPAREPAEAAGGAPALAKANYPGGSKKAKPITREDILKLVVADSLGYLEKVRADGWGGLTCAESGRVGGIMTRRMKRVEKGLPPA